MNARDPTQHDPERPNEEPVRELAARVRDRLDATDSSLAVAETCTGGGVGAALTAVTARSSVSVP